MKFRAVCSAILTLVAAIVCLIIAISGFFTPLLVYAQMHLSILIGFLIIFVTLLVGAILGFCGIKRRSAGCIFALFFINLISIISI